MMPPKSRSYAIVGLLGTVLLAGFLLRILNLGGPDFGIDEILHVYAAQSLTDGDAPALPSGYLYKRALPYTYTVALSGKLLGLNEVTARLSSVIFGCLTILMVFHIGRQWYSAEAGLVAAFLTAVAPMQIAFSREVRVYAMFQLAYLGFIFLFFQALETSPRKERKSWIPKTMRDWCIELEVQPIFFLAAAALLFFAIGLHRLTFVGVVGPIAYTIGMAIVVIAFNNFSKIQKWKYMAFAAFVTLGMVAAYVLFKDLFEHFIRLAHFTPEWAEQNAHNWKYYYHMFLAIYPFLFETLLLTSLFALSRNPKATVYAFLCFILPFVVHSVMAWKNYRYVFHIVPLMFILASAGLSSLMSHLYQSLKTWTGTALSPAKAGVAAGISMVTATMFFLAFMPWFRQGIVIHGMNEGAFAGVVHSSWQQMMRIVSERAKSSDIVITSVPLLAKYYGPELPLYYLNNDNLRLLLDLGWYDDEGRNIEYTAGAPIIRNLKMLEDIVSNHSSGWLVTERHHFLGSLPLEAGIRQFVEKNLRLESVPGVSDIMIWRWDKSAAEPSKQSLATSARSHDHRAGLS